MGIDLPRALLAEHATRDAVAPFPRLPPAPPARSSGMPFRPSVAVIVVVLTTMFSLTFLLLLYAKHCRRQAAAAASTSGGLGGGGGFSARSGLVERRTSGVERAVVESLPLFRFGSLRGEKEGLECAVCLGRFEPAELLRLLPKCRHAFHVDCVDAWLDSHSTCPLCRSRVDPEDVLLLREPPPPPPPPPPPSAAMGTALPSPTPEKPPARRISGRHSSAGEKSSGAGGNAAIRIVVRRPSESGAAAVALERQRKDGLLLPPASDGGEGRYSHRVVFSGGEGAEERWSDLRPSDLMFLRSETTITASGRFSAAAGSTGGGEGRFGWRSASEITGVSRVSRASRTGMGVRPAQEERTMRRWLGFAAKRTARWLGRRGSG